MLSAFEISARGLMAERRRLEVVANNLANVNTTRTPEGTPFRRQLTVLIGEQLRADRPKSGGVVERRCSWNLLELHRGR